MTTVEAVDVCDSAGGHKVSHFSCDNVQSE